MSVSVYLNKNIPFRNCIASRSRGEVPIFQKSVERKLVSTFTFTECDSAYILYRPCPCYSLLNVLLFSFQSILEPIPEYKPQKTSINHFVKKKKTTQHSSEIGIL